MPAVQRIRFFDMAKGIGILCVVLGHAAIESIFVEPSNTAQWAMATCFSFHMPLFFLIAGYFMHPERDFQWRKEGKQLVLTVMCRDIVDVCLDTCFTCGRRGG